MNRLISKFFVIFLLINSNQALAIGWILNLVFGNQSPEQLERQASALGRGMRNGLLKGVGQQAKEEALKAIQGLGDDANKEAANAIRGLGKKARREFGDAIDGVRGQVDREFGGIVDDMGNHAADAVENIGNRGLDVGKKAAFLTIGASAGVVATYGTILVAKHYATEYITKKFSTPDLQLEQAESNLTRYIKDKLGYKYPSIDEMIFSVKTKDELNDYISTLKVASEVKKPLPSLLLYGPPGTGKTEAAKRIAKAGNYNFVFLSGSSFAQYDQDKGITMITELFKWADKTSWIDNRKVIIFIDEAENFLGKRGSNSKSEKSEQLLTHFLSLTGKRSENYAIIYATNRPNVLDKAMNRRIAFQIEVPLPETQHRADILKLYCQPAIENLKNVTITNNFLTDDYYLSLAQKTEGLSGSDLEEICERVGTLSYANDMVVDQVLFEKVISSIKQKYHEKSDYTRR